MNYAEDAKAALMRHLPGADENLLDLYTLLVLVRGTKVTLEDVHDAWSLWRTRTRPEHRSIVPFAELSGEVQELDRKYADAIRTTAESIAGSDLP